MADGTPATCPGCGFCWDATPPGAVPAGVAEAADGIVSILRSVGDRAEVRPEPACWSVLEYAGHVRDVLLAVRERLVMGTLLDGYESQPILRDARIDAGFARLDTPEVVAAELTVAAGLLGRTVDCLPPGATERRMGYAFLGPDPVPLRWVAAQGLHEARHHLDDVRAVAAAVGS